MLLAVKRDLAAGILAKQNRVAGLYFGPYQFAGLRHLAFTNRHHLALLRFFLGRIGDNDPPLVSSSCLTPLTSNRTPSGLIFIGPLSLSGFMGRRDSHAASKGELAGNPV